MAQLSHRRVTRHTIGINSFLHVEVRQGVPALVIAISLFFALAVFLRNYTLIQANACSLTLKDMHKMVIA